VKVWPAGHIEGKRVMLSGGLLVTLSPAVTVTAIAVVFRIQRYGCRFNSRCRMLPRLLSCGGIVCRYRFTLTEVIKLPYIFPV